MAVDYATLKKGGFMRQKQKNHFSLRLRVVGGNLTAKQLAKIAEVAETFGDGHVHLTSRQSVEIPFIKLDDIDAVKEDLAKGGCKPGVCGPRVRTITSCQGNQICPSGNIDTYDIAKKLDYKPNRAGIALAAQRKMVRIGVVLFDTGNPFFDEVWNSVLSKEEELNSYNLSLIHI